MEYMSPAFDDKRRDPEAVPVAVYMLLLDMGGRIYTAGDVPTTLLSEGAYFDASVDFDSDVYFDGGVSAVEIAARVVSFGEVSERSLPIGTEMLQSFGESERSAFELTLSNEDGALSPMLADEILLGRTGMLLLGYVGLGLSDYLEKYRGAVETWTLDGSTLTLTHLEA